MLELNFAIINHICESSQMKKFNHMMHWSIKPGQGDPKDMTTITWELALKLFEHQFMGTTVHPKGPIPIYHMRVGDQVVIWAPMLYGAQCGPKGPHPDLTPTYSLWIAYSIWHQSECCQTYWSNSMNFYHQIKLDFQALKNIVLFIQLRLFFNGTIHKPRTFKTTQPCGSTSECSN